MFLAAMVVFFLLNLVPSISEAAPHKEGNVWVWDIPSQAAPASPWSHQFEIGGFAAGLGLPGKDAFGIGGLELGYQPSYKLTNGQKLGPEVSAIFGGYDKGLAFGLNFGGVWYPYEHFGVSAGYQFLLLKQTGKADPGLGHYGKMGIRVPITSWFELTGFGLLGWGSYQTSKQQTTTTGDLTVTTTGYHRHTGLSGGGGGGASFKF